MSEPEMKPIQGGAGLGRERQQAQVRTEVYMRAYEVYVAVYGEQKAIVEGDCRGGFGKGELVAFLYARSFPREEWRKRVDEAFEGIRL